MSTQGEVQRDFTCFGTHYRREEGNLEQTSNNLSERQALLDWHETHGGTIAAQIELGHRPSQGLYLAVREGHDLSPGNCIVSCPKALTLSYLNALSSDFSNGQNNAFPVNFTKNVEPHVVVRFFLMEQYLLGKESFWAPYIDLLPSLNHQEFLNTPMWYSIIDALWIRGTNLEQAVQDRERSWRAEYEDGLRQLLLEHTNFYPGMLQRAKEGYSW
ncbi:MAG: hypothetical protein LQ347_002106 [Umbilicaria vellea]|nr:MAG: hypothetical protein LQ347_002106 [Umbilicaria vellea]